jgi:hypothetical protein
LPAGVKTNRTIDPESDSVISCQTSILIQFLQISIQLHLQVKLAFLSYEKEQFPTEYG